MEISAASTIFNSADLEKECKIVANRAKKERKFKNAIERIKRAGIEFSKYQKAIDCVYKKLHNNGWFDSTEEIIAAIELTKNRIRAKHQVKIGRYCADFLLVDLKVILEIDGICYHNERTRKKESVRDKFLLSKLGTGWEVVRITDKFINDNFPQLLLEILIDTESRKKARLKNGGKLPQNYITKGYDYY